jgi:hypothetical protein
MTADDIYVTKLRDRLRVLDEGLKKAEAALAALAATRDRLTLALEVYAETMGLPSSETDRELGRYGDLTAITIPDGCQRIMEVEDGRANQAHLTKVLEQAGKLKGKHTANYASVIGAMERHPERFRKLGHGEWELVYRQSVTVPVQAGESSWQRVIAAHRWPASQVLASSEDPVGVEVGTT